MLTSYGDFNCKILKKKNIRNVMSIAFRISVFMRPSGEKIQQSDKGNCKSLLKYEKRFVKNLLLIPRKKQTNK